MREGGAVRTRPLVAMPPAQIVERRAEDAPVGQPGQRIFGRQPRHMRFGFAALRDVGEGLHEAAVRQLAAADFDDVAVRHLAFGDRDLSRRLLPARWRRHRQIDIRRLASGLTMPP